LGGTFLLSAPPLVQQLAAAVTGPPRKRFMAIMMPNCSYEADWVPQGGRDVPGGSGDATAFTLNVANRPLEAVRPYLTIVDGINIPGDRNASELHGAGIIGMMTGETTGDHREVAVRPSIDQLLATSSPMLSGARFPSLVLACDSRDNENLLRCMAMSYRGPGRAGALVGESRPAATYMQLFGGGVAVPNDPAGKAALERTLKRKASVLDFVRGSIETLRRQVPVEEHGRLDQHLEGIREAERSLAGTTAAPVPVNTLNPDSLKSVKSDNYPAVFDSFREIIRVAFALDQTRVVSLMLGSGHSQVNMSRVDPTMPAGTIHSVSHSHHSQQTRAGFVKVTNWYCERIAKFVTSLAQIRESDGSSVLDNTLILFFSEVIITAKDPHQHHNHPVALFGGKAFGTQGGRSLRFGGRSSNDLMLPIVRAFGVQATAFGKPEYNQGALSEVFF
jgi:hypothetical protein